jgi:intracellular sulfur oxidation DsrE/DsrF family protein
MKKETLGDLLRELPGPGEYYHIVSNGRFDYFTFLPVILDRIHHITELYGSTWTMNRQNVTDLLEYIDQGRIDRVTVISGLYFKRRETSVYATLLQGLTKRGMCYLSCENHAKVMLLRSADSWYVIEGSANWTANPRIEQNILVNSEQVYLFHRDWMESLIRRV